MASPASSYNWLWQITDLESAAVARREGAAAAFVVAAITKIFSVLFYFNVLNAVSHWALIDAGVMATLGFFIRRNV